MPKQIKEKRIEKWDWKKRGYEKKWHRDYVLLMKDLYGYVPSPKYIWSAISFIERLLSQREKEILEELLKEINPVIVPKDYPPFAVNSFEDRGRYHQWVLKIIVQKLKELKK